MSMSSPEAYAPPPFDEEFCVGENFFVDLSRDIAKDTNKKVGRAGENEYIFLGEELGDHPAKDTRYRDSIKQGFLTAYIRSREYAEDLPTGTKITLASVAIGTVIAGVAALHYKKKK